MLSFIILFSHAHASIYCCKIILFLLFRKWKKDLSIYCVNYGKIICRKKGRNWFEILSLIFFQLFLKFQIQREKSSKKITVSVSFAYVCEINKISNIEALRIYLPCWVKGTHIYLSYIYTIKSKSLEISIVDFKTIIHVQVDCMKNKIPYNRQKRLGIFWIFFHNVVEKK